MHPEVIEKLREVNSTLESLLIHQKSEHDNARWSMARELLPVLQEIKKEISAISMSCQILVWAVVIFEVAWFWKS